TAASHVNQQWGKDLLSLQGIGQGTALTHSARGFVSRLSQSIVAQGSPRSVHGGQERHAATYQNGKRGRIARGVHALHIAANNGHAQYTAVPGKAGGGHAQTPTPERSEERRGGKGDESR